MTNKILSMNRSFARRIGKSLSNLQKSLLEEELKNYAIDLLALDNDKCIAEIGIGSSEHFIARAKPRNDELHIGFEPYLNGVANCLKLIKDETITNVRLWADDFNLIWNKFPDELFSEVYILFPDPWPKARHHKRRLLNADAIKIIASKMHQNAILYFVSDIDDYFNEAHDIILSSGIFNIISFTDESYDNYVKTKYHLKAEQEGRKPMFLLAGKL